MKISTPISLIVILSFFSGNSIGQNVGIGVPTPLQKLHVGGNLRVDGMASPGTGIITTNAAGDLLRTNFSGNANDVLKGNGTFGVVPGGLPSGAIVASDNPNDANLIAAGFSFYGELPSTSKIYSTFPGMLSNQFTQAPTYENGNSAKNSAPRGRSSTAGVWTGTEIIIYGGFFITGNKYIFLNDGSRYNPSTDTWTPMSLINSPSSRSHSSVVWTGTELLVWGGLDSATIDINGNYTYEVTNTGGKYNPTTNTWINLPSAGPSARAVSAAVWTGTNMVVWGGTEGYTRIGDGGRYNPATNTWTLIPANVNSPGDSYGSRIFWTGSRVLILGNGDSIGRYNPAGAGSWDPVTTFPGGSYNKNAAVWTGSELWIYDKPGNQIYKYNPANNVWSAPIVVGGLTTLHSMFVIQSAAWTDTEMVLYGYIQGTATISNRYYRYMPGSNEFNSTDVNNQFIQYNRVVDQETLFFKAGSMIFKWGGYLIYTDDSGISSYYFSRQGTRIYLTSGVSIPTIYVPGSNNSELYLYQKN